MNHVVYNDWDKDQDFNYVLKTWLLGTADNFNRLTPQTRHEFLTILEPKFKALLNEKETSVKCVYSDEDCIFILSFIVYNMDTIYFIHTKPKYRNNGFCRGLISRMEEKPRFYIETNTATKNFKLVKSLNLSFDPTIIFGERYSDQSKKSLLC